MTQLSGAQRKHLRGLAHSFTAAVQVGKEGLSDAVVRTIGEALGARELIKVRLLADREERRALVVDIEARTGATCVGTVGAIAILYLEHPDPERRKIRLAP